jgi:hypothetical protein
MISICDDQEGSGARACPGYAAGMPRRQALARSRPGGRVRVLPGRDQPQHAGAAVSVGHQ